MQWRIFSLPFFGFAISFFSAHSSSAQQPFTRAGARHKKDFETFSNWDWSKCQKIATINKVAGDSLFVSATFFNVYTKHCCIDTVKNDTQIVKWTSIQSFTTSKETIEWIGEKHLSSSQILVYDPDTTQPRKLILEATMNFVQYDSICESTFAGRYNVWSYNYKKQHLEESKKWVVDTCFIDIRYPNGSPEIEGQYYAKADCRTLEYKKMGIWRYFNPDGTLQREENHSPFVRLRQRQRE